MQTRTVFKVDYSKVFKYSQRHLTNKQAYQGPYCKRQSLAKREKGLPRNALQLGKGYCLWLFAH